MDVVFIDNFPTATATATAMRSLAVCLALCSLSGCAHEPAAQETERPEHSFNAAIGIVNHTDRYIYSTAVNGEWGGHAHPMSAGVAGMCCVTLPATWQPGLTVKVDWDMPEGTTHIATTKIVQVERYDKAGNLYVHFFPDDAVRVVVTLLVGASPNHPITPPPGTMMHLY
jgi:hypothetical protein